MPGPEDDPSGPGMEVPMKLALIQIAAQTEKEASLQLAESYIRKAAAEGADLAVLPEMFCCPYSTENFPVYAESENGMCRTRMAAAARENRVFLVAGSMPELDSDGRVYNTSYVFDREGKQIARHRKVHLFDINVEGGQYFRESDTLSAGDQITTFEIETTEFENSGKSSASCSSPLRCGLMICYDIRFPEFAMKMAQKGASLIIVPAAFNMTTGPAHWELLFRARALDDQVFMAGCSQARNAEAGGYISYGHSIVVSPWGEVLAQMDEREGMIIQEIDLSVPDRIREQLPVLKQRRTDLYG